MISSASIKGISPIASKLDNTPVIRSSTFFSVSPFSYPKTVSFALIGSVTSILVVTPVQPKNWLILLEVYAMVLVPLIRVPESGNPIVESTAIVSPPISTGSRTLEYPGTMNSPSIRSLSLYPTNNPIL